MECFLIEGGHRLSGTIVPQGAKNEALQVISATLLTTEEVVIDNIPNILDVNNLIKLLTDIGVKVTKLGENKYSFCADEVNLDYLESVEFVEKCSSLRGSVLLYGPLLGRFGKATIAKPGGDKIGRRRLDTHFLGFKNLGAHFEHREERNVYELKAEKLVGTYMLLDEASVTGTANIVMAAVFAEGKTTIYNAACEPYLQQLCKMLNAMGAKISGIGSNLLTIEGVKTLKGTQHRILPDMIEVGSFIYRGIKHIHGALGREEILLGVDNVDQIANTSFRENKSVTDLMIKSQGNGVKGTSVYRDCHRLISEAHLICIFGLSLGPTDQVWWTSIKERFLADPDVSILYFCYGSSFTPGWGSDGEPKRRARQYLVDALGLGGSQDAYEERIFIALNSDMFPKREKLSIESEG